jgi:hypothetical protein
MTKGDLATLAAAIATFEAFADLQFTEVRVTVTEPDGRKVKAIIPPETVQELWRALSASAVKHIQTQVAEHEAKSAVMN